MIDAEVRSRIALARLMVADELFDNLRGELGARTALSRAYYGLFHSAHALLLTTGDLAPGRRYKHGEISRRLRRRLGRRMGQFYEDVLSGRREADYEPTATFQPLSVQRQLKSVRRYVHWFCSEAGKVLK